MIPGISARPSASISSFPAPARSTILPPSTARSPCRGADPSPSRISALRITRSCIAGQYTSRLMFDLQGKTAVVTGGAKGIGAATVELFEKAGAKVQVLDIVSGCDVTDSSAVKRQFEKLGSFDILVNNAGRAARKPAVELTRADWDAVMGLNVTAVFECSRLAHPYLKKSGGCIVNLASIMGLSGGIYPNASYQASKGAVVNLTR